eukprot:100493_1
MASLPLLYMITLLSSAISDNPSFPLVANLWPWTGATDAGYAEILSTGSSVSAVVTGCSWCETNQCDGTVGYGGSPDSTGNTTLDAMIMYGPLHTVGSVGNLRNIKNAIGVARAVMEHSDQTLLCGQQAGDFAKMMGFNQSSLNTNYSHYVYNNWTYHNCQPNYFRNVFNQSTTCPPYKPIPVTDPKYISLPKISNAMKYRANNIPKITKHNHDTIGMIAIELGGNMTVGTSTNGANHKIAGRVGDSPIVGAGAYVEQGVGASCATGDGDIMMRFVPTFQAVYLMESGYSPSNACKQPLEKIAKYYPDFQGALLCIDANGTHAGYAYNWPGVQYSIRTALMNKTQIIDMPTFTLK